MAAKKTTISAEMFYQYATAIATTTTTTPATAGTHLVESSSSSSPSAANVTLHARITLIAYCYILPMICVIGIIGNITNLMTLASKRLRAVSYMYLRALAVADLLCMIFVLLFVSGEIVQRAGIPLNQSPIYGFYQAHLMLSLINWALATGVLIVVALSLDRFISIVFPMYFRTWNAPQRARKIIVGAYLLSGIFHIPYGIGRYAVGERINQQGIKIYAAIDSEASKTVEWQVYKWTREGLLRFAPILILSVLNIQIMTAFRRRQKLFARLKNRKKAKNYNSNAIGGGSGGGGGSSTSSSKDDTLVYILGGIVAVFFICNIPAALNLLFINETVKLRVDYQIFRAVANLLEITNHASQFYVFCACSTDYRITFLEKFACFTLPPQYRRPESRGNLARGSIVGGQSGRINRLNSVPAVATAQAGNHSTINQPVASCKMSAETNQLLEPESVIIQPVDDVTGRGGTKGGCGDGGGSRTEINHYKYCKCGSGTTASLSNGGETPSLFINYHNITSNNSTDKKQALPNENTIEFSSLDDFL